MKNDLRLRCLYPASVVCTVVLCLSAGRGAAAGQFQNLGFESAVINGPLYSTLPASEALPFWTPTFPYATYDTVSVGSLCVSIHDNRGFIKPLAGNYSVILQPGETEELPYASAYISQTGDVPAWAESLMFVSDTPPYIANDLFVSLNGTVLPFTLYSTGGTINANWGPLETYACDVSAFAGQANVALKFTTAALDCGYMVDLDAIQFSTIVVPEPSALVLLGVAILTLAGYRWRFRRGRPAGAHRV